MKQGAGVSAAEFRADYHAGSKAGEDRNEIWTYYVARPVSFYLAAASVRAGMTANQVTWLSILILIAGCALLGSGGRALAVLGALLINVWLLLDCVDGNIARYQKTFSTYGAFLDSIGGYATYALVPLAAGLGAYNRPDDVWLAASWSSDALWLFLGAWASITALWTRLVFQKFRNSFGGELRRHALLDDPSRRTWRGRLMRAGNNLLNVSGGALVLLFVATLAGALDLFLLFVALGNSAVLALTFFWLLKRAAATDR